MPNSLFGTLFFSHWQEVLWRGGVLRVVTGVSEILRWPPLIGMFWCNTIFFSEFSNGEVIFNLCKSGETYHKQRLKYPLNGACTVFHSFFFFAAKRGGSPFFLLMPHT
jgi:hypothetical protein